MARLAGGVERCVTAGESGFFVFGFLYLSFCTFLAVLGIQFAFIAFVFQIS